MYSGASVLCVNSRMLALYKFNVLLILLTEDTLLISSIDRSVNLCYRMKDWSSGADIDYLSYSNEDFFLVPR
jgi:hypothetical protein